MWKGVDQLWAIRDEETGRVLLSRGGSSTKEHLLVYGRKGSAERALKSEWIKQVINPTKAYIDLVWVNPADTAVER